MPELAFTRRAPGKNPIALELDRLAEQKALQGLGASEMLPRSADQPTTDDPMTRPEEIAAEGYTSFLTKPNTSWADALNSVPDDQLNRYEEWANTKLRSAMGTKPGAGPHAWLENGEFMTGDDPTNSIEPNLEIIKELDRRRTQQQQQSDGDREAFTRGFEAPPATSEDPTIGTRDLHQSIRDQIAAAKRLKLREQG
jgi:hypothetical protein